MKSNIPEAPKQEIIEEQNIQRISDWIKYFETLSPRIKVITPDNSLFENVFSDLEKAIMKTLGEGFKLHDWPKMEDIVFIILFDSAMPNQKAKFEPEMARIFCFGDIAFGPGYFEWDGDGEEDPDCSTYSLANYSDSALSWHYITKIIKERLSELDTLVPPLK